MVLIITPSTMTVHPPYWSFFMGNIYVLASKCRKLLTDHGKWIRENISKDGQEVLRKVGSCLLNNRTSRHRKPIKNFYKMLSFYFISLSYPLDAPVPDDETVKLYKVLFKGLLERCFGENGRFGVSYHAKVHYRSDDHRQESPNFHIILIRPLEDKEQIEQNYREFEALPEDVKPRDSLFFLKNLILLPNEEVTRLVTKEWAALLSTHTGLPVEKLIALEGLVMTTGQYYQDLDDFADVEDYLNNDAMRAFKKVDDFWEREDGMIMVKKGERVFPLTLKKFLNHYLIRPNHQFISPMRWDGYGGLSGTSRFGRILEYATLLRIHGSPLFEFSPEEIVAMARERTRLYGDDRMVGYELTENVRRLKYERVGLLLNKPDTDWPELVQNGRMGYQYELLFTFADSDTKGDEAILEMLVESFEAGNVAFLGRTANGSFYRVKRTSFCDEFDYALYHSKLAAKFGKMWKKWCKANYEGFLLRKEQHGFHYVKVEWFPAHIHTLECSFNTAIQKPSFWYNGLTGLRNLVRKVFSVETATLVKHGTVQVFSVSVNSVFAVEEVAPQLAGYCNELERRYRGVYRAMDFDSSVVEVRVIDSKPWTV